MRRNVYKWVPTTTLLLYIGLADRKKFHIIIQSRCLHTRQQCYLTFIFIFKKVTQTGTLQ